MRGVLRNAAAMATTAPLKTQKASNVSKALRAVSRPDRVHILQSFFKTGPGEYAEGDKFIGIYVGDLRKVVKEFRALPEAELRKLIVSPWHEERVTAVAIVVDQFAKADPKRRGELVALYLAHAAQYVNNWDLVDGSAPQIVGVWLHGQGKGWSILRKLARSKNLWERRIAIIATFYFIRQEEFAPTLEIAERLLGDTHDLIHKAVGWMLREVGKRDEAVLVGFLDQHLKRMPRTMLRYAIERFPAKRRLEYLKK